MTPAGNAFLIIMGLLSLAGMMTCAVRTRKPSPKRRSHETIREIPELPGEPVIFRTAELRFVDCKTERERRGADFEIYGERAIAYERQELAAALLDQLLASGGITFSTDGNVVRAELRAVIRA